MFAFRWIHSTGSIELVRLSIRGSRESEERKLTISSSLNRDLKSRAPNSIIAAQIDELIRSMESAGM